MNIRLTEEQKIRILNSADIFKVMQQVLLREKKIDRNKEHFWVVCLASNNQILLIELISLGTVNQTLVEPMEVFSFALQKRAVKIVMVHNHPSGDVELSDSDYAITEQMVAIGKFLRVPVIDHLIISETDYMSFKDKGYLDKIDVDNRYDLSFTQVKLLLSQLKESEEKKKEMAELIKAKEKEMEESRQNIAQNLLNQGLTIDAIMQATGLSKEQIEKLKR